MIDNSASIGQSKNEQGIYPVISATMKIIQNGEKFTEGRLKHVRYQLRIENDLLMKSGQHIVPASMRKFVVGNTHNTNHLGRDKTYAILKDRFLA